MEKILIYSKDKKMNVCMYGASSNNIPEVYLEKANEFGKKLAEFGHVLVYGGGNSGVMGAAAKGVLEKSGTVIGIAPHFFKERKQLLDRCTYFFYTETMRERKQMMEDKSDAFVMMPGGIGTFEEFFEILTLKQLSRHNKPIIVVNINGYFQPLLDLLKKATDENFLYKGNLQLFSVCNSVNEIFDVLRI